MCKNGLIAVYVLDLKKKTQDIECCVEQKGLEFVDATGLCGVCDV